MNLLKLAPYGIYAVSSLVPSLGARIGLELLFRPRKTLRRPEELDFWNRGRPVQFASGCSGRIFGEGDSQIWIAHGWQSRGSRFQSLIQSLVNQGYSVVAWDGPGHGDSHGSRTHLADFSRCLKMDLEMSSDVIGEHRQQIKTVGLIGHSFGGAAAAVVCSMGADVGQLVLIASPSSATRVFERYWDLIRLSRPARTKFLEMAENEMKISLQELSSNHFIKNLPQKILVIHDENDGVVPFDDALEIRNLRQEISFLATCQRGHNGILDAPETMSAIGGFFRSGKKE